MDLAAIELSHLRLFVALAEELHFGRAAARVHMAQPPLTRQIRLLESRLDVPLFERNTRSTRLTAAGEQLLPRARAVLAEAALAFESAHRAARGEEGQLTIATAPSLMLGDLPRRIRAFRKKYPNVEFRLHEMATSVILQSVRTGAADLGFVRGRDKESEITTLRHWPEPMVAIVPTDFPVPTSFRLAHLRAHPFVFFPRTLGPAFHEEVMACCRRAGFQPAITQEARQWSSIISLVSAGMGVSLGPQSIAALLPKSVRYLPLPKTTTTVRLIGRANAPRTPAIENFLTLYPQTFPR